MASTEFVIKDALLGKEERIRLFLNGLLCFFRRFIAFNMPESFFRSWSIQTFRDREFFLDDDREALAKERLIHVTSYRQYATDSAFRSSNKKVRNKYGSLLHANLFPVPFQGNLAEADIFFCLINPGFSPLDYIVERNSEYLEVLKNNLKQDFSTHEKYPFFSLDPKWLWTGGGSWWARLFQPIIQELIERKNDPKFAYDQATQLIAKRIASLELVPYHSANSGRVGTLAKKLPSAIRMKEFVKNLVSNRVEKTKKSALLVIASGGKKWEVPEGIKNVVPQPKYHRKAVLSMEPNGSGSRVLEWLLK